MSESFARQKAATRNFQLGAPRTFHISKDAQHVLFVRSAHSRDVVNALWVYRTADKSEHLLIDPQALLSGDESLPAEEQARRERMREQTSGITTYSVDHNDTVIAFALSGLLFVSDFAGNVRQLDTHGAVIDPRVSPDGHWVAWSSANGMWVHNLASGITTAIAKTDEPHTTVGLADFIAAEELGRMTGYWWAADSSGLLVETVNSTQVETWWISDPADPAHAPREYRYPQAGTTNADVSLTWHALASDSQSVEVSWPASDTEYLVRVSLTKSANLLTFANRAQTRFDTYTLTNGTLELYSTQSDEHFLDVTPGQPVVHHDELVEVVNNYQTDTRQLVVGGKVLSPAGLQILSIVDVNDSGVTAIATSTGVDRDVVHLSWDGAVAMRTHGGANAATASVFVDGAEYWVQVESHVAGLTRSAVLKRNGDTIHDFTFKSETPTVRPEVTTIQTGPHAINTAVLFPTGYQESDGALPVLMRPYGGPHGAQVVNSALIYLEDQWWADQGYVVVIADNRGTPGRGPAFERTIFHDFVNPVLNDQVSALHDVASRWPERIDTSRVGIAGWSFGGYLSALAVIERPDVFHVGIAGAPVTEWTWYDTAYTERYLGDPREVPEVYEANSLLHRAHELTRPLMLIHGFADDNVVVAHTLDMSSRLMAAGKPHTVLPLSGITHMASSEAVAENLMLLQLDYFDSHLKA